MARCGQISWSAASLPRLSRQITSGMSSKVCAFIAPGRTSNESSAGYQKPVNGAATAFSKPPVLSGLDVVLPVRYPINAGWPMPIGSGLCFIAWFDESIRGPRALRRIASAAGLDQFQAQIRQDEVDRRRNRI